MRPGLAKRPEIKESQRLQGIDYQTNMRIGFTENTRAWVCLGSVYKATEVASSSKVECVFLVI